MSVDLLKILEGQSFSFPRWSFDLKEFKNFLLFNLDLPPGEPKKKDKKAIEERNDLIRDKLSTFIATVHHQRKLSWEIKIFMLAPQPHLDLE